MKNFDYDSESDDLFVYLENKKSSGAVELGNFILDFDNSGSLIAIEILDASKVFNQLLSKVIELSKIKEMKADVVNFRNMDAIKFQITTDKDNESANILVPHIKKKSPVLEY